MKRALLIAALAIAPSVAGCADKPREQLPPVSWNSESEAREILARRATEVKTVSAQGLMTMRRPDGQSVRLDIAMVGDADGHLRLRAWKLGRAVFDLTMNKDGVWMLLPDDPSIRNRMKDGQLGIKRIADSWELFNGRFLAREDLKIQSERGLLICEAMVESSRVRCEVDRATLTPRRYLLTDADGVERFSLGLSEYRIIDNIPYARRYTAVSEIGEVLIALDDVELNTELAPAAFVPPRRAEKLP